MQTVVIVGGGFAGLAAARRLHSQRRNVRVVLVDGRQTSDFLPLLPDVVSGRIRSTAVRYPLATACRRFGFEWVREHAEDIDVERRILRTSQQEIAFDFLIMACGSVSDFHGVPGAERYALPLKSADDADRLAAALKESAWRRVFVCGGGYTGVETASHIISRLRNNDDEREVVLIEPGTRIMRSLPDDFIRYSEDNLTRMGVKILTGSRVTEITGNGTVSLSDGTVAGDTLVVWSAGVKAPNSVGKMGLATYTDGRIQVGGDLQFAPGCFAVGDTARIENNGSALRMGIQFSLAGGNHAAGNILRLINGIAAKTFTPFDPGYIIPMANSQSCGRVLGVDLHGRKATFLHYFMCGFRTWGIRNRIRQIPPFR